MSDGAPRAAVLLRAVRLVLRPETEWTAIAREPRSGRALLVRHVLPLCAIPAIAWAIGISLFPRDIAFLDAEAARHAPAFALRAAVVTFIASAASVAGLAALFYALAPLFDARRDWQAMWAVAAYGSTPVLLAGVFLVRPLLVGFLLVALIHAGVLYASGLHRVALVRRGETAQYVAATLFCAAVLSSIAGAALSAAGLL